MPAGKTTIKTPVPVTVRAYFLRCFHEDTSGFITIRAASTFAMVAGSRFIFFIRFCH